MRGGEFKGGLPFGFEPLRVSRRDFDDAGGEESRAVPNKGLVRMVVDVTSFGTAGITSGDRLGGAETSGVLGFAPMRAESSEFCAVGIADFVGGALTGALGPFKDDSSEDT